MDAKYAPFRSTDDPYKNYSYISVIFTHFFLIPRFLIGWCLFFTGPIVAWLLSIGEGHLNGKLPKWKLNILIKVTKFGCWAGSFACGIVSQRRVRVSADYSKWLGPDYEYTYDNAGMHITNHQCQLDLLLVIYLHHPVASHLGKREALKIPLIRHCAIPMDFIMVGRDKKDSKDEREKLMKNIEERVALAEQGKMPPVSIFPEGATSNG